MHLCEGNALLTRTVSTGNQGQGMGNMPEGPQFPGREGCGQDCVTKGSIYLLLGGFRSPR